MKFAYRNYGLVLRPVVPITVCNPNTGIEINYQVLVDSGAEVCIFSYEIGEALGLDFSKKKQEDFEYFGVGGKQVACVVFKVHFQLSGWSHSVHAHFLCKKDDRKLPYGIVGQQGFFQFFKVTFDRHNELIEIRK